MAVRRFLSLLLIVFMSFACKSKKVIVDPATETKTVTEAKTIEKKLDSFTFLKKTLQGNFSTKDQHDKDKDFYDIRMRLVPIWKSTENVFYIYVEQAMATTLNNPFSQQVYKVVKDEENTSTIFLYTIPEPERFKGRIEGDYMFESIDTETIVEKTGCELRLQFNEETMSAVGDTGDKTCTSGEAGIAWTSSQMIVKDELIELWNQSWDVDGNQLKGSVKGGYIFKKEN